MQSVPSWVSLQHSYYAVPFDRYIYGSSELLARSPPLSLSGGGGGRLLCCALWPVTLEGVQSCRHLRPATESREVFELNLHEDLVDK